MARGSGKRAAIPSEGTQSDTVRLHPKSSADSHYWDIDDIQFHCRIGRTTAWRLVRSNTFPAPVVLGPKSLVWPREEVVTFMEARRQSDHYAAPKNSVDMSLAAPYRRRPLTHERNS